MEKQHFRLCSKWRPPRPRPAPPGPRRRTPRETIENPWENQRFPVGAGDVPGGAWRPRGGARIPVIFNPKTCKNTRKSSIFDCTANHIPLCIQVIVARCCLVQAKVRPPVAWIPVETLGNSCISCGAPQHPRTPWPVARNPSGAEEVTFMLGNLVHNQSAT